jgi:hypothetical protein
MNRLFIIIGKTIKSLGSLTFILSIKKTTIRSLLIFKKMFNLVIVLFIFAVVGKELFGESYITYYGDNMPRWNFTDVFRSFMIVFRVLCGEWIESMWDCLNAHGWPCVPFFLGVKIIGGFVVNILRIFVLKILIFQNFRFLICSYAYF